MSLKFSKGFFLFFTLVFLFGFIAEAFTFSFSIREGHSVTLSCQAYWMRRTREGGSEQTGVLKGFWTEYERFARERLYWSVHFYNAKGILDGHTGSDARLKSNKKESEVEGRIGYCLTLKRYPNFCIAPFIGFGAFTGNNQFIEPSPLEFTMETHFLFTGIGFKSQYSFTPFISLGMQLEVKIPYDVHCKIKNFDELENVTQFIKEKAGVEVELPFQVKLPKRSCFQIGAAVVPFYRYRKYGAQSNYPFDYPKTSFQIAGARMELKAFF